MKHIFKLTFILILFCTGCSDDSGENNSQYFKLRINDVETVFPDKNTQNSSSLTLNLIGSVFILEAYYGVRTSAGNANNFRLIFDKKGNVISARHYVHADGAIDVNYSNYSFFVSNYYHVNILSLNESSHKVKLSFSGNLYYSNNSNSDMFLTSLDREFVRSEGELNMEYNTSSASGPYTGLNIGGLEQYCSAKFNNVLWEANRSNEITNGSYTYGSFMASDPYKIEINFARNANLGSYNFNTASTENRIRFSKFNATTLTYDYYNVSGILSNDYKEFHGGISYSYFGTYSFTATNPNNPADVIQVTDGKFRYYQSN